MNKIEIFTLKAIRKVVNKMELGYQLPPLHREMDPDAASEMIYNLLTGDKPCMIARFGSTELSAIINYLGVTSENKSIWKFLTGEQPEWWWNHNILQQMQQWSGFFPPTMENVEKFCEMMLEDAQQVDILGSWLHDEYRIKDYIKKSQRVSIRTLNPYWAQSPWSLALKNKKVLVVHPFIHTIQSQYNNHRDILFTNNDVLPEFSSLEIIKAVQSLGESKSDFSNWFDALDWMKEEISNRDFDICLIGCGAYGFPLAAYVKRMGKKAVHLGGSLQLLFGIKGKRWDDVDEYKNGIYNEYWVRPFPKDMSDSLKKVENGCYI